MMPVSPLDAPAWVATERFLRAAKRVFLGVVVTLALTGVLLGFAHTRAERPAHAAKLARD